MLRMGLEAYTLTIIFPTNINLTTLGPRIFIKYCAEIWVLELTVI